MTQRLLLSTIAMVASVPYAWADSVSEAEHVRLTEEMRRLSKRNAWKGVDIAFQEMEKLQKDDVELTYENYWLGAEAARAMGNINAVYVRLKEAARLDGTEEVIGWLSDLDGNYGQVELVSRRKAQVTLGVSQMPFAPDQRAVIETAVESIESDGRYTGLLPKGQYEFGGEALTVDAGQEALAVTIIDEKIPRAEREPFRFTHVGPRLTIGPALTSAGDPSSESWAGELQPPGFGGGGGRVGLGLDVGLGEHLGAFAEVGYHGGFAGAMEEPALSPTWQGEMPWETSGSSLNVGYGWLGATWRQGPLWFNAGPTWSAGTAYTDTLLEGHESCERCVVGTTGSVRAGGLALGASYALTSIGSLAGALSLYGGGQSDGSRIYTWGQLAFTLAPASTGSK